MRVGHPDHFGATARERRRQLNLTLDGVKAAGGPTGPTVIRAEAGELEEPRPSTLAKFDQALQWVPGSAARVFWDRGEPRLPQSDRPPLDPGAAEVSLPLELVLELLTTQRRLGDFVDGPGTDLGALRAISGSLNEQISALVGMFVTDLLERNRVHDQPGQLHPLLMFAFGDLLDSPANGPAESEEKLYRRWLIGRESGLTAELTRAFQARLDNKLRMVNSRDH
ncbi:hypothetical protein [Nocardia sp. NPDC052566]|uniref:hypothetical protein n=1 Tax=Nocardia sp. NPDC052566 TaxID=3364330 RepID=UPI0037C9E1DD